MSRRRQAVSCKCGQPARRVKWAKWCSRCYTKLGRPRATCRRCDEEFATDQLVGKRCRPCISEVAHNRRVEKVYNLTDDRYQELLLFQSGRCWVCLRKPVSKRLAVDHDHSCCPGPVSCGKCVRGLLCRNCNRNVLGHLRDDVTALQRAIDYLEGPPAKRLWPDLDVTPRLEDE